MRVTLFLFLLVFGSNLAFGQLQFLGFDHNYCPDALSMNYTYSNWFNQLTEQGGYKIYRDGVEVYSSSTSLPNTPTCDSKQRILHRRFTTWYVCVANADATTVV